MLQAPKGTKDVLPNDAGRWQALEQAFRDKAELFGYRELRTPVFEHTELFLRGVGETTDVVQKEMYTFLDKGGRSVTLKPEGTAGAVRAFIEHGLYNQPLPLKLYYFTPVFRYERPQSGRLREHHQFGVEVFGAADSFLDAELIALAHTLLTGLSLTSALHINSIGCPQDRARYNEALRAYYEPHREEICETCRTRLEQNPLRLLDCKVPEDHRLALGAPTILEHLCPDCESHFSSLQKALNKLKIPFAVNPHIVRGLDYYTKTVFEFIGQTAEGELTLCGGGRYDTLVNQIGGPATPGAGFGIGLERLLMAVPAGETTDKIALYIATAGDRAKEAALPLLYQLRAQGIYADMDYCGRSLKAQFKYAGKMARQVVTLGDAELDSGTVTLKNMETGAEESISLALLPEKLNKK